MPAIVEERKFSLFNVDGKNNKFWNVALYDNGDWEVHFGPQGQSGTRKMFHTGRSAMEKKIREKTSAKHANGAYVENKVLGTVESTQIAAKVISKTELHQKAIADIGAHQSPELKKLITYFADVNAHNLLEASGGKITYDASAGTFRTTQGVITLDQVELARDLLNQISLFAEKGDFTSEGFKKVLNPYLSLIPQKGLVRQLHFPSMFGIAGEGGLKMQSDMLDGLASSYADCLAAPKDDKPKDKKAEVRHFKVTMKFINGGDEVDKIRKYYKATKGNHSDVASYDVKSVYSLAIEDMHNDFEAKGRAVGNLMRLWHGTGAANCLSILKGGMIIPKSGGSIYVCGRNFGDGIYFSDQSTKSIRYATGAWGGSGGGDRKFMFLVDVAMGNMYTPKDTFSGLPPKGYDSCFAKGGFSGRLANNEMIVYKRAQCDPVYIIEFTPYGK